MKVKFLRPHLGFNAGDEAELSQHTAMYLERCGVVITNFEVKEQKSEKPQIKKRKPGKK